MDQGNNATVSNRTAGVPAGMPSGTNGEAGSDLAAQLDAMLAKRLAVLEENVVKKASDQVWKGAQRVMDQRFSRLEPVIGQMQQTMNTMSGHFQKAEDETLDPDERRQRDQDRRLQESQQQVFQANLRARQWQAHANVQRALKAASLDEQDPRLTEMWNDTLQQTDPDGWATSMVQTIGQIGIGDARSRATAEADTRTQAERRRSTQLEDANRTLASNAYRTEEAGHLETGTPVGGTMDWKAKYDALVNAGDHAGARRYMETLTNRVRRGLVKRPEQF